MAVRIYPNIEDTTQLLGAILLALKNNADERIQFLVPAGQGQAYLQRVRVKISRERNKMRRDGKKPKRFTLHSEVFPWTENGKRHDSIIVWKYRGKTHELRDIVEEVLSDD